MRQHPDICFNTPNQLNNVAEYIYRLSSIMVDASADIDRYTRKIENCTCIIQDLKHDIRSRAGSYAENYYSYKRIITRFRYIKDYKESIKQCREEYNEAAKEYLDFATTLFKHHGNEATITINKAIIDKQVALLPFVWKHKYYVWKGIGYLRVWFKPYTMRRFNAHTDKYGYKSWQAYPFRITLKLDPAVFNSNEGIISSVLKVNKVPRQFHKRASRYTPSLRPFPHYGCLGSAEPHLLQALQHGAIAQFLDIYHTYFSMSNVNDAWKNKYIIFRNRSKLTPPVEELTEAHYRRYIPYDTHARSQ